jgi:hypothetical protein
LSKHEKTSLDRARDELFSHINRCGVLDASDEQQKEWMDDTLKFLEERYPDLSGTELEELEKVGLRYCQPVIRHGKQHTASTEWAGSGSGNAA